LFNPSTSILFGIIAIVAASQEDVMSDIFISYNNEDRSRAELFAQALEGRGWSVFWDRTIPTGRMWRETIGKELSEARCVVVLWSKTSIDSDWVREEADDAKARRVLVPVRVDNVQPPLGFRGLQTADLVNWKAKEPTQAFDRLTADIAALIGSPPAEQAVPTPGPLLSPPPEEKRFRNPTLFSPLPPGFGVQGKLTSRDWHVYYLGVFASLAPVVVFSFFLWYQVYLYPSAIYLTDVLLYFFYPAHLVYGVISALIWVRICRITYVISVWVAFFLINIMYLFSYVSTNAIFIRHPEPFDFRILLSTIICITVVSSMLCVFSFLNYRRRARRESLSV
jgi:hypothetical protein